MRLHHIIFGSAGILLAYAWAAPMAWTEHAALVVLALPLLLAGLVFATGSKFLDVLHPARKSHFTQRDVNRAFDSGRNLGAAEGPDDKTRRRWQREGFEV